MKVGDLVKCTWQPKCGWSNEKKYSEDMKVTIKGEYGIIIKIDEGNRYQILFPKFNYTHILSTTTFEVISESR